MLRLVALGITTALAVGCGNDEVPPERVAFSGIDPSLGPRRPNADYEPEPAPKATTAPPPQPPAPKPVSQGRLQACCSALQAMATSSGDPGRRANAAQASRGCLAKMSEVQKGKMSVDTALSQVRSSMLGGAPFACN
jgi:hypothetical protein